MRTMNGGNLGETLAEGGEHRIHLCGRLTVRIADTRIEESLPGRQGRMLFAYLAAHRARPTPRGELHGVLWPESAPAAAESALAALLAKLRRTLGAKVLTGRQEIRLALPEGAWIDIEAAGEGLHRAESAVAQRDWAGAWGPARVALHIAARAFMPGYEAGWIDALRYRLEEVLVRAHECVAASGTGMGGAEVATAERSARRLIELAPFRESGYRYLMQALAMRDNVGEALIVYEQLRRVLREELGASPGAVSQALHARLLNDAGRAPAV
jgi:DNA-binding SARP family transcriptional activator